VVVVVAVVVVRTILSCGQASGAGDQLERCDVVGDETECPSLVDPGAMGVRLLGPMIDPRGGHGRTAGLDPHQVARFQPRAADGHQSSSDAPSAVHGRAWSKVVEGRRGACRTRERARLSERIDRLTSGCRRLNMRALGGCDKQEYRR
jgi:hypothetical protein